MDYQHLKSKIQLNAKTQMCRRIFNTLPPISAVLFVCIALLWAWSLWADPERDRLSLTPRFHVGVYNGRMDFFNDRNGPYHGSVISLIGFRAFAECRGFGDTCGIYYRYFRWADSGAVLWTLSVSLAYPLVIFAVLPTICVWKRWRRAARSDCGTA